MNFYRRVNIVALVVAATLTLAACGSVPRREAALKEVVPLVAPELAPGVQSNSDKLFVVVTFSGGGKRAAAFSYGVLEALRDIQVTTPDGERRALLDEIDLVEQRVALAVGRGDLDVAQRLEDSIRKRRRAFAATGEGDHHE